ncbi:MAG TPA: hypothetical protein VJN92_19820 [Candidatus Acidoferrum sp.]|nr:hypothetical protein [Candidatus Acidoferrum sp.]
MIDECHELGTGEAIPRVEIYRAVRKDAVELRLIRPFNCQHCIVQRLPKFALCGPCNLIPNAVVRHDEIMHHWVTRQLGIAEVLFQSRNVPKVYVVDPFVEEKREHVAAKLRMIYAPAKGVGGFLQKDVKLGLGQAVVRGSFDGLNSRGFIGLCGQASQVISSVNRNSTTPMNLQPAMPDP